jgi:hypothetical protein
VCWLQSSKGTQKELCFSHKILNYDYSTSNHPNAFIDLFFAQLIVIIVHSIEILLIFTKHKQIFNVDICRGL